MFHETFVTPLYLLVVLCVFCYWSSFDNCQVVYHRFLFLHQIMLTCTSFSHICVLSQIYSCIVTSGIRTDCLQYPTQHLYIIWHTLNRPKAEFHLSVEFSWIARATPSPTAVCHLWNELKWMNEQKVGNAGSCEGIKGTARSCSCIRIWLVRWGHKIIKLQFGWKPDD